MLQLFVESSKTDQYRDGAWVVVSTTGKATCPVTLMYGYLDKANVSHDSPPFCQLSKTKYGYKPRPKWFGTHVGTHGLRSGGGGGTAAANTGVLDRLFKRHGRWSSESAKDGFVKDSLSSPCQFPKL